MTNFSDQPQTRMRRRRLNLGFTQRYLAVLAQVNPSDLSRWENRRSIPYDSQADRLAEILGLKPQELQQPTVWDPQLDSSSEKIPAEVCE